MIRNSKYLLKLHGFAKVFSRASSKATPSIDSVAARPTAALHRLKLDTFESHEYIKIYQSIERSVHSLSLRAVWGRRNVGAGAVYALHRKRLTRTECRRAILRSRFGKSSASPQSCAPDKASPGFSATLNTDLFSAVAFVTTLAIVSWSNAAE